MKRRHGDGEWDSVQYLGRADLHDSYGRASKKPILGHAERPQGE